MKKKSLIRLQDIAFGTIVIPSIFLLFNASGAYASTSAVDDVTVTVPAACTMSSTVNSNHTATVEVGSYVDDIGETTFKVTCNDAEGFSVYAIGYTNDEFGNTTMKPSILADTNAIATGLATSGDTSNWAMKLTAVTGDYSPTLETGFNAYHVVPSEYTKVALYSSNTDSSSGSSFKSTYAAFIASAQPADTYTGKVKYTVVHPANAEIPSKTISQLTYMQDFNTLSASDRASVLNSMADNTTYNLIDNRDNKTYKIAKLKDGNIWMAENLDLGRTALTVDLTSANTNLSNSTLAAATFNSWVVESGDFLYTSGEIIPLTGSDSTSLSPYGTLYNYCATSAGTVCMDQNENNSNATSDICPAGWRLPTGGLYGEYQVLYDLTDYNSLAKMRAPIANGGAAFANAGQFYGGNPSEQDTRGYYWTSMRLNKSMMVKLSLSGSSVYPNSGYHRYAGYSVRCVAKNTAHTVTVSHDSSISGVTIYDTTVHNGETILLEENMIYPIIAIPSAGYGFSSWSATAGTFSTTNAQATIYSSSNTDATITINGTSYISTEMQDLSQSSCTSTPTRVRDVRDNHVYTIQRLADNNCWMMENLDLGRTALTTDLTSTNTNLSTTIAAATFNGWNTPSNVPSDTNPGLISVSGADFVSGTPHGSFYNYCAVSAGTICTSINNSNDATYDICPAGWRLPTGGDSGELKALYSLSNYDTLEELRAPITSGGGAFALAGDYTSDQSEINNEGNYWGSTRDDNYRMHYLSITKYGINTYGGQRNYGNSVRCIRKP